MNEITQTSESFPDVVNGALQVIIDFLNVVVGALPNPDPFPQMIQSLDTSTVMDMGFAVYWLDAFCDISVCVTILNFWLALMIDGGIFAVIYWVVKSIRG